MQENKDFNQVGSQPTNDLQSAQTTSQYGANAGESQSKPVKKFSINKNSIGTILLIAIVIVGLVVGLYYGADNAKELEISLDIEDSNTMEWIFEIEDEKIVQYVSTEVSNKSNKTTVTFIFKGLKGGNTGVSFKLVSKADHSIVEDEFECNVIVANNLNISMTA